MDEDDQFSISLHDVAKYFFRPTPNTNDVRHAGQHTTSRKPPNWYSYTTIKNTRVSISPSSHFRASSCTPLLFRSTDQFPTFFFCLRRRNLWKINFYVCLQLLAATARTIGRHIITEVHSRRRNGALVKSENLHVPARYDDNVVYVTNLCLAITCHHCVETAEWI